VLFAVVIPNVLPAWSHRDRHIVIDDFLALGSVSLENRVCLVVLEDELSLRSS